MNDDNFNPDDPFDAELSRALGALAPELDTPDDAYARALPTFVRARRRHRILTTTGGIAVGVLAIVGIALTSGAPSLSGVRTVDPAHRGSTRPSGTAPDRTDPTTTTSRPLSTNTAVPGGQASPGDGTAPTSTTGPEPTNGTTPAGSHQQTVSSAGGSIVVTIGDRTVTLNSEHPAAGYSTDIRASGPDEVEVRFRIGSDGNTEHRIRLRFDSAGNLVKEIT